MQLNIKSRKGFTLIELLVVIGILAVLAAIAIPSVAGLIDRANVSADKTNSNEMTNAMERFASEYELFCQDIASGTFDKNNMDSAQSRVFNIVNCTTRAEIYQIEKNQNENSIDLSGVAIYRDTKYPANYETAISIIQNYSKTSSSTFEPKQSDCHYYYSPDCGIVVCTENKNISVVELNKLVKSGTDAKGNVLSDETQWIDLTDGTYPAFSNLDLSTVNTDLSTNTWEDVQKIVRANKTKEAGWNIGSTKSMQINGQTKTAVLIGINHDGVNTATFLVYDGVSSIAYRGINSTDTNTGGWKDSEIRQWLNSDVYNSMTDVQKYIKTISKITNNTGYTQKVSSTMDNVFLLSPIEANIEDEIETWDWYPEERRTSIYLEGNTYEWFLHNSISNFFAWLRSPCANRSSTFFAISRDGTLTNGSASANGSMFPAFVIG